VKGDFQSTSERGFPTAHRVERDSQLPIEWKENSPLHYRYGTLNLQLTWWQFQGETITNLGHQTWNQKSGVLAFLPLLCSEMGINYGPAGLRSYYTN